MLPAICPRRPFILCCFIYFVVQKSCVVHAADRVVFDPPELKIVWRHQQASGMDEEVKSDDLKAWRVACSNLAKGLMAGRGPWGMGVFRSVGCYISEKLVAGKEPSDQPWILSYQEGEHKTDLKLKMSLNAESEIASISFRSEVSSIILLSDQGFTDLISLRLLNELPFMGWISKGTLNSHSQQKYRSIFVPQSGHRPFPVPEPPEALAVYSSVFSGQNIMPAVAGVARRSKLIEPEFLSDGKTRDESSKSRVESNEFSVTWTFDDASRSSATHQGMWLHDQRGARQLSKSLDAAIVEASIQITKDVQEGFFSKVQKTFRESVNSGGFGVRYGRQALSSDPLLKKTAVFGIDARIGGGGVHYFYDKIPSTRESVDGLSTNIQWSRHLFGKAYGFEFSRFLDRVEVIPRAGLWSFDAKLVDTYDSYGQATSVGKFKVAKGLGIGFEAGAEWRSKWYRVRPWYAFDFANAVGSTKQEKILSNRVGIESFWTSGPVFHIYDVMFRTSWLGFFSFESLTLQSSASKEDEGTEDRQISKANLMGGYAGVGALFNW
jgi:hypothetical protein